MRKKIFTNLNGIYGQIISFLEKGAVIKQEYTACNGKSATKYVYVSYDFNEPPYIGKKKECLEYED